MMEQIVTVGPLDFGFPTFDILGIGILRHHNRLKQQTPILTRKGERLFALKFGIQCNTLSPHFPHNG